MKSLKASMEGEWFGLTCGYVCARLLSAKTLTSPGSPWWILGSRLSDSLRILRQMKSVTFEQSSPNVWGEEKKRERERVEKKNPSHLLFLPSVSVSTHSIIRVAPSDCLRSSLYHPAKAVLLQLAFKTDNKKRKTIHLGFFIRKNSWREKKRSIARAGTNNPRAIWLSKTRSSSQVSTRGGLHAFTSCRLSLEYVLFKCIF